MAVDEQFADRIRTALKAKDILFTEKYMFGGIAFMVRGHIMVGIMNTGEFMARVGKEQNDQALKLPHAKQMQMKSKVMAGYIEVTQRGVETEKDLLSWIELCNQFNKTLPQK